MSFNPGIGELILVIQTVIDVYGKCKDAPGEVDDAVNDAKRMKAELESIEKKIDNEKYFVTRNGKAMLATITETVEPLKADMKQLAQLIRKFMSIPPYSGEKIIFALFKIPDVKKIQANFEGYRAIWSRALEHAGAVADVAAAEELKALKSRNEQLAKQISQSNDKVDEVIKLLHAFTAQTSQQMNETPKAEIENQLRATGLDDKDVKKVIGSFMIEQTVGGGTPPITVTQHGKDRGTAGTAGLKRNKSQSTANKLEGLPVPSGHQRARSVSQTRDSKGKHSLTPPPSCGEQTISSPGNSKLFSPSGFATAAYAGMYHQPAQEVIESSQPPSPSGFATAATAASSGHVAQEDKKGIWILCVDSDNGWYSILAQIYLELLRMWTANTSSASYPSTPPKWLFTRVSTAGLNISSPLLSSRINTAHTHPPIETLRDSTKPLGVSSALDQLLCEPSYFRSGDYPHEKACLRYRVNEESKVPKGLKTEDFETYKYMLCFDPAIAKDLERLRHSVSNHFRIKNAYVPLEQRRRVLSEVECILPSSAFGSGFAMAASIVMRNSSVATEVGNVKQAIKEWAARELWWVLPYPQFDHGPYRTLQLILPIEYRAPLLSKIEERRKGVVEGVAEMKGVWVWVSWLGWGRKKQLVILVGPKDKLRAAEAWVRGLIYD